MQINNSTIVFKKESKEYQDLENKLMKIAASNSINDISEIVIKVSKDQSLINFKKAKNEDIWYETIDELSGQQPGTSLREFNISKKHPSEYKRMLEISKELEPIYAIAESLEFKEGELSPKEKEIVEKNNILQKELEKILNIL